jgi:hypothetical protein
MNPAILFALALGVLEIVLGCAGSRRTAPAAAAAASPPRVSTEVSVIPPQELKEGRPFVQFSGSVSQPEYSVANDDALVPAAGAFNSDMQ